MTVSATSAISPYLAASQSLAASIDLGTLPSADDAGVVSPATDLLSLSPEAQAALAAEFEPDLLTPSASPAPDGGLPGTLLTTDLATAVDLLLYRSGVLTAPATDAASSTTPTAGA